MTTTNSVYHINIENETLSNENYRRVLFTSNNQQLVIMNLKPGEDIPLEIHRDNDQFIRIEAGTGIIFLGENKDKFYNLSDGHIVMIPAGTYHQIINTSPNSDLKLYTIYSPPHHSKNKIDTRQKSINVSNTSTGNLFLKIQPTDINLDSIKGEKNGSFNKLPLIY